VASDASLRLRQLSLDIRLREDYRFNNFVGAEQAVSAIRRQINGESDEWLSYLWGNRGSGRSHLLAAAIHEAHKSGLSCIYFDIAECLTMSAAQLLDGLQTLHLVCIDNIDLIAGNEWELALFNLLNAMDGTAANLLVAALHPPPNLRLQLVDLKTRLMTGFMFQLAGLSDDEKLALLTRKAESRGFLLTKKVGRFILNRSDRDLPALLNSLDSLDRQSVVHQKKLTIPFVKNVLKL